MGEPLFHLADRGEWLAAVETGEYRVSTRGMTLAEQGYIHCSLRHQLRDVAEQFYADAEDLVVLVIDPARVPVPIRYEPPVPGAEEFPHVYGPLPVAAVSRVIPVSREGDDRFVLPG
ncbi:MAG: DUF952 domain-containing protein [Actinobacteria bacterium]|nr:DUF952 domain-containing protein [Actinomycetota bacterium]